MLHINNACIAFGTEVLFSGFEMKLEKGETACIVGQSGCGKTSLLNAVMGFVPLYEGTIKVGGTLLDKSTIDLVRRQIAWIPQELALPFEWVKEMVSLPFELKVNRSVPFSEERLYEYFDDLGLEHDLYTKRVNEVSGGQRQRIAIARGLAMNPELLLFDEPTSALDPETIGDVLAVMQNLAKGGMNMVVVTHEMGFARSVADRIIFMAEGQVLVDTTDVDGFFDNPTEPRAVQFLSKIIDHNSDRVQVDA